MPPASVPASCGCDVQAGKAVHACGEVLDTGDGGRFLQLGRDMKEQRKYTSCCALQGKANDARFQAMLRRALLRIYRSPYRIHLIGRTIRQDCFGWNISV